LIVSLISEKFEAPNEWAAGTDGLTTWVA